MQQLFSLGQKQPFVLQPGSNQNGSSNTEHHIVAKSKNQPKNSSHGYVNLPMPFVGEYQSNYFQKNILYYKGKILLMFTSHL